MTIELQRGFKEPLCSVVVELPGTHLDQLNIEPLRRRLGLHSFYGLVVFYSVWAPPVHYLV